VERKLALIGAVNNKGRERNYEICLLEKMEEHGHTWTGWTFSIKEDKRKILEEYISKGEHFNLYFYMSKRGGGSGLVEYRLRIDDFRYAANGMTAPDPEICCKDDLNRPYRVFFHVTRIEKIVPPLSLEIFQRWDNSSLKARPLQNAFEFVIDLVEPRRTQRNWWIEKTYVKGRPHRESGDYALGKVLWSPQTDESGKKIYENMKSIKKGDVVLHLVDNESIVGVSVVEEECDDSFKCLPGTEWDDGTGKRPGYLVRLRDYQPLSPPIEKREILNEKNREILISILERNKNVFYNRNLQLRQGGYITKAPLELVALINKVYKAKTGKDLPYFSTKQSEFKQLETLHLLYKIAWHPGGYKGGFCGNAKEKACEAFQYIRKNKAKQPCSPTIYHCIDEHEAFANYGWKVTIHPRRVKKLHELSDGKSLIFLVAPLNRNKSRYRLVGFYRIKRKIIKDGEVEGIEAEKDYSSKFDLSDKELEFDKNGLMKLFNIKKWTPRLSYEFISSETAIKVLNYVYEKHKDKRISDPDVNLNAMKIAIESLQQEAPQISNITVYDYMSSLGFYFEEPAISAFYVALKTKGFVILAGLTGTGKTKLPQLFCELVAPDEFHKLFVPVRPGWRDSKPLLGYFNPIEGKYEATELLKLIIKAHDEWKEDVSKQPFFVILDEMNLARVEYYFADFLSVLESGRDENSKFFTKESILLHSLSKNSKTRNGRDVPPKIELPPNLYFIGTVNLDETTYSFSPKVLDRAFVVEFWQVDLDKYRNQTARSISNESIQNLKKAILEDLSRNGKFLAFDKNDIRSAINSLGDYYDDLKNLNDALQKFGLHFGYRVVDEIALFYQNAIESQNKGIIRFESNDQIIDYAVLMKVLPKIHGNRAKVETALYWILAWTLDPKDCEERIKEFQDESGKIKSEYLRASEKGPEALINKIQASQQFKYPKTAEKVARMLFQLYSTGFTSYL